MSEQLTAKSPNKILKTFFALLIVFILLGGSLFAFFPLPGHPTILMYHFLGTETEAQESKNHITAKSLERQLRFLKQFGYRVISLDEYYDGLIGKRKPRAREVLITFDDGNYTFYDSAFTILRRYQFPVTQFLVSENIKQKLHGSMTEENIHDLLKAEWFSVGSHSRTHPSLAELNEEQIRDELVGSKKDLEAMFERPVNYLAYPSGNIDERVVRIAEEAGYRLGFTTSYKKLNGIHENLYTITRVKISRSSDHILLFWFKVTGIYDFIKKGKLKLRQAFLPAA